MGTTAEPAGPSEYERYIRTAELLALQKPATALTHHDELLFQCTHQVMELWLKVIGHELAAVIDLLTAGGSLPRTAQLLNRTARLLALLGDQLTGLETMYAADYMAVRAGLGRGSGQDSPGFRGLMRLPPLLWAAFRARLRAAAVDLDTLVATPHDRAELYAVLHGLLDVDAGLQRFRHQHLLLAKRQIGDDSLSLKGTPMQQLEQAVRHSFFPELWAALSRLTADRFPSG